MNKSPMSWFDALAILFLGIALGIFLSAHFLLDKPSPL